MLTIEITDKKLEKRVIEKAKAVGISVQELINNLLDENLDSSVKTEFSIPRMDYKKHSTVINNSISKEDLELITPDIQLFSTIENSANYTHELRRKSRI